MKSIHDYDNLENTGIFKEIEEKTGRQFNWFWYFADMSKNKFLYEDSCFQAAIGRRRSGKSVFCLAGAAACDPDFNEERACFGIKELIDIVKNNSNCSISWEEAGTSAYSRNSMEDDNKRIARVLQVIGFQKIALYANFQHLKFLDVDVKIQIDAIHKMKANYTFDSSGKPVTYVYDKPYAVITDYMQEPIIAPYKVNRAGIFSEIGVIPFPDMNTLFDICGLNKGVYKAYLKKKREYFEDLGEEEKKGDEEEIFSKRELKTLTRVNQAFLNLTSGLIEEGVKKNKIASLSDIPVSTLNVWLQKTEEAPSLINRIVGEENNNEIIF